MFNFKILFNQNNNCIQLIDTVLSETKQLFQQTTFFIYVNAAFQLSMFD